MTITYVLMQNLRRNRLRTALTAIAFALPMGVFVSAISFVAMFVRIAQANEKELRLGVHHRTTLTNYLPDGLRRKIEGLDPQRVRLSAVCGMRWFGGRVPETPNALTSLAADADTFPIVYSELDLTPEDMALWQRDKRAAIVGMGPAETYHWKVGQRVVLESTVPPYLSLEFNIIKISHNEMRTNFFYFRRDYLEDSLKEVNADGARCNIFWIKCQSAEAMRSLQEEIDRMTANTPDETKTEDENAFVANFTQALGDIPGLMQVMAAVVVFIIALVAGNTMMMSFRERTRELAVFKAIGFQAPRVFSIIMAESVMLATIGSLLGVVPTATFLLFFPITMFRFGPISRIEVSPLAVVVSLTIALLVGLLAGVWPAYQAMRLRTVDALRRVA